MENTLANKFKNFFAITLNGNLSIVKKFKEIFKNSQTILIKKEPKLEPEKQVITIKLDLNNIDSEEEFEAKLLNIKNQNFPQEVFSAVHEALIQTSVGTKYINKTMDLLENSNENQRFKSFESAIKFDVLEICKEFLNNPNSKYNVVVSSDDDYYRLLSLSIKEGAKKITEYFLQDKRFIDLLADPVVGENCLKSCLLLKETGLEIVNMLISHNVNMTLFKENITKNIGLDNDKTKNIGVINQIQKKLLHDELSHEFNNEKMENKTIFKRTKL